MQSVCIFFHICRKFEFLISQGSVATCLRWGEYCHIHFVANFIRFPAVQKFWKSVKSWQNYRQLKGGKFLRHSVCVSYRAGVQLWRRRVGRNRHKISGSSQYVRRKYGVFRLLSFAFHVHCNCISLEDFVLCSGITDGYYRSIRAENNVITFRVSRRRREMYCGHARLCVRLCVCVSVCPRPHAYTIARTLM